MTDWIQMQESTSHQIKQLCDSRTGILTQSQQMVRKDMPVGWLGWSTSIADTTRFRGQAEGVWKANPYSFGVSAVNESLAAGASIGEAAERYCGNFIPEDLISASWNELLADGVLALEPNPFALYSKQQYATPGFPFVPFTKNHATQWVEGIDLRTGESIMAPAPMVYLSYYSGDRRLAEAPIAALQYAGISCGQSYRDAVVSAILELIERDTSALWWFRRSPLLRVTDWEESTTIAGRLWDTELSRQVEVYMIPNEFDVPTAIALVSDKKRGLLTFGSASRLKNEDTIEKAIVEAYSVAAISIDLIDENGPTRKAWARGSLPSHLYVPHRQDRAYMQDFPPPFKNMLDLPTVGQYYLDPRAQKKLRERINSDMKDIAFKEIDTSISEPEELSRRLHNYQQVVVDLTTTDMWSVGLRVVRLIVPGLYNNSPPAFPFLGGDRLYSAKRSLPPFDLPLPLA